MLFKLKISLTGIQKDAHTTKHKHFDVYKTKGSF